MYHHKETVRLEGGSSSAPLTLGMPFSQVSVGQMQHRLSTSCSRMLETYNFNVCDSHSHDRVAINL